MIEVGKQCAERTQYRGLPWYVNLFYVQLRRNRNRMHWSGSAAYDKAVVTRVEPLS